MSSTGISCPQEALQAYCHYVQPCSKVLMGVQVPPEVSHWFSITVRVPCVMSTSLHSCRSTAVRCPAVLHLLLPQLRTQTTTDPLLLSPMKPAILNLKVVSGTPSFAGLGRCGDYRPQSPGSGSSSQGKGSWRPDAVGAHQAWHTQRAAAGAGSLQRAGHAQLHAAAASSSGRLRCAAC